MFGVCSSRRSQSSMFLLPFHCSSPIWTSATVTLTSSAPPDSDVIPEVDTDSAQCRHKLDSVNSACTEAEPEIDDCSCSQVDVITSRPNSPIDDDDDENDKRHRCHDDVIVTSSAVTSLSKELKFGIDRILIKNNNVKDTSPSGIALNDRLYNFRLFELRIDLIYKSLFTS